MTSRQADCWAFWQENRISRIPECCVNRQVSGDTDGWRGAVRSPAPNFQNRKSAIFTPACAIQSVSGIGGDRMFSGELHIRGINPISLSTTKSRITLWYEICMGLI